MKCAGAPHLNPLPKGEEEEASGEFNAVVKRPKDAMALVATDGLQRPFLSLRERIKVRGCRAQRHKRGISVSARRRRSDCSGAIYETASSTASNFVASIRSARASSTSSALKRGLRSSLMVPATATRSVRLPISSERLSLLEQEYASLGFGTTKCSETLSGSSRRFFLRSILRIPAGKSKIHPHLNPLPEGEEESRHEGSGALERVSSR